MNTTCHTSVNDQDFAQQALTDESCEKWALWCAKHHYICVPPHWTNERSPFAVLWTQLLCGLAEHAPHLIKDAMLLCAQHLPDTKSSPVMFASVLKRRLERTYDFNHQSIDNILLQFLVCNDTVGSQKLKLWLGVDFLQECLLCTFPRFDVIHNIIACFNNHPDQEQLLQTCLRHLWMSIKWCEQMDVPLITPLTERMFDIIAQHICFDQWHACITTPDIKMAHDHPNLYQHTHMFIDYVKDCSTLDIIYRVWPTQKLQPSDHTKMEVLFADLGRSGVHMPHTKALIEHRLLEEATDGKRGRGKKKM